MATLTTSGLEGRAATEEHDRAARKLEDAMNDQARWAHIYQQSLGTSSELDAYMHLREARGRVTAFDRWLRWVDDEDAPPPPEVEPAVEEVLGH
jgi:hypothetical protein